MRKLFIIFCLVYVIILLSGCGGVETKNIYLHAPGRMIIDGKMVEPPYNIENTGGNVTVNGTNILPIRSNKGTATNTYKSVKVIIEEKGDLLVIADNGGLTSHERNLWEEIKGILQSTKKRIEKKVMIMKLGFPGDLAEQIIRKNKYE